MYIYKENTPLYDLILLSANGKKIRNNHVYIVGKNQCRNIDMYIYLCFFRTVALFYLSVFSFFIIK